MDHRPKCKCKTVELLENNTREYLDDLGFGDDFLDTTKEQSMKEKNYRVDFIKLQNFCSAKDTFKRMRRQPTDGRKHLQDIPDKGLLVKTYKELLRLSNKTKNSVRKRTKDTTW